MALDILDGSGLDCATLQTNWSPLIISSLNDSQRICPVLAGSAFIQGGRLVIRLIGEEIRVRAPKKFLAKLFIWCQGEMTLAEIDKTSSILWGGTKFGQFIRDLLVRGVLIDASTRLLHLSREVDLPNLTGRLASESVWRTASLHLSPAELPPSETHTFLYAENSSLISLLAKRESAVRFGRNTLTEQTLAQLLQAAYGYDPETRHRTVASAGGLYRLSLYVILLKQVGAITPGVYAIVYSVDGASRLIVRNRDLSELPRIFLQPHQLCEATGVVVIAADMFPGSLKYCNRIYPYALLEGGSIVQNIGLAAAETGFGWRVLGGFDQRRMTRQCALPDHERVLIAGVFGALPENISSSAFLSKTNVEHAKTLKLEFCWSNEIPDLPFHVAMARLTTKIDDTSTAFSWGRDADPKLAYDKAVAEATERHTYCHLKECSVARWGELDHMCAPASLVRYKPSQYRQANFPFRRFDPSRAYLWKSAQDVNSGQFHWLPAEFVFHSKTLPKEYSQQLLYSASSSGCAAGPTPEQAQEAALFELIERDSFMRHWFAQQGGLSVLLQSLPDAIKRRVEKLEAYGCMVSVQLLDASIQPVWMVIVQHVQQHFTAVGAGAGPNAELVLGRALSEAEINAYARFAGLGTAPIRPREVMSATHHASLYGQRQYFRHADKLLTCHGNITFSYAHALCAADISCVYADIAQRHLQPLWIDLSLEDSPRTIDGRQLYSGRMIIPGLIPITFGFARMPLGMDTHHIVGARFPHPFP